jgi:hypothetical protein
MLLTHPLKGRQAQGTGTLLWSWPKRSQRSEMGHSEASNPISVGATLSALCLLRLLVRTRRRRLQSVKVRDFLRVGVRRRHAKSLRGIHGSVGWCGLLCSLMAKVELRNCFGKPRYAPEVESSADQTAILVPFGVLLQQKCSVEVVFSLLPNSFLEPY